MMNTDLAKNAAPVRKPHQQPAVMLIVEREFFEEKPLADAFISVIANDLQRRAEDVRTSDNARGTA